MSLKSQFQMKAKQRKKRIKSRKDLVAKGQKLEDFYYGKFYLKAPQSE